MIVMPGVVFDRSFSRLGYGKGFYDRFLSTYTGITSHVSISTPFVNTTSQLHASAPEARASPPDLNATAAATRRPIPKLGVCHGVTQRLFTTPYNISLRAKVAVALQGHVLDEEAVPVDQTDWRVDAIVSPTFQDSNGTDDIVLRRVGAGTID
jgi:5-formyltetrahydrofolate cyclo-ligase